MEHLVRQKLKDGYGFEDIAAMLECHPDYIRRFYNTLAPREKALIRDESVRRFQRDWKSKFPA